jgi:hypothetical protein
MKKMLALLPHGGDPGGGSPEECQRGQRDFNWRPLRHVGRHFRAKLGSADHASHADWQA